MPYSTSFNCHTITFSSPLYPTPTFLPLPNSTLLHSTQPSPPLGSPLPFTRPLQSFHPVPLPYHTLPYSIPLLYTLLYPPLPSPLLFPPLAAFASSPLPLYPTLHHDTPPYLTLPSFFPTQSLPSQPTPHHSTLPHSIPCTISYPALHSSPPYPYPSLSLPTIPSTPRVRPKSLGPKGIGTETSKAETAWCRNV